MTAVLEADGLGKRYGHTWALSECTLSIPAGKVVGLVGPNGAGKSTLLQLSVGLLRPDAGITSTILGVAQALGLETVAEGVEQPEAAAKLLALGCDQAQGYYFSPPVEADELCRMLESPTQLPTPSTSLVPAAP